MDHSERKAKRLRTNRNPSVTAADDRTAAFDAVQMQSALHMVHLYELAVDSSQQEESSLVELGDVGESERPLQTNLDSLASVDGVEAGVNFPLALYQTVDCVTNSGGNTGMVVMSECPAADGQHEMVNGITAAILSQGGRLVINEPILGDTVEGVGPDGVQDLTYTTQELSDVHGQETQVIAYFETIPNVLPCETSSQFTFSPETVLSSALSSKPISSTLPIVSKRTPPSPASMVLTLERLDSDAGEGDEGMSEAEEAEQQDHQLEEHW